MGGIYSRVFQLYAFAGVKPILKTKKLTKELAVEIYVRERNGTMFAKRITVPAPVWFSFYSYKGSQKLSRESSWINPAGWMMMQPCHSRIHRASVPLGYGGSPSRNFLRLVQCRIC
jgi:hypothetical protein